MLPPPGCGAGSARLGGRQVSWVLGCWGGFGVAPASLSPSSQLVTGSTGARCPCSQQRPRAWSHHRAPLLPTGWGWGGAKPTAPHHPGPFAPWHGQGLGARGCPVARGWLRSTRVPPINWTLYFCNSFLCLFSPKKRGTGSVPPAPSPDVLEHPGVALGAQWGGEKPQPRPRLPPFPPSPPALPILQQEGLGCRGEPQHPIPTRGGTEANPRHLHPDGTMRVGFGDLGVCPRGGDRRDLQGSPPRGGGWEDVSRASTRQGRAG